jgi:hypothetical protein
MALGIKTPWGAETADGRQAVAQVACERAQATFGEGPAKQKLSALERNGVPALRANKTPRRRLCQHRDGAAPSPVAAPAAILEACGKKALQGALQLRPWAGGLVLPEGPGATDSGDRGEPPAGRSPGLPPGCRMSFGGSRGSGGDSGAGSTFSAGDGAVTPTTSPPPAWACAVSSSL